MKEICKAQLNNKNKDIKIHKSALLNIQAVQAKLIKEFKAKLILGPFPSPVFQDYCN